MLSQQYASIINLHEIESLLEEPVRKAMQLPSIKGNVEGEFLIERRMTSAEIMRWFEMSPEKRRGMTIGEWVPTVKEREIKLSVIALCGLIYKSYKCYADEFGFILDGEHFRQVIEIQISYLDRVPGDTAIGYDVFAKMRLEQVHETGND